MADTPVDWSQFTPLDTAPKAPAVDWSQFKPLQPLGGDRPLPGAFTVDNPNNPASASGLAAGTGFAALLPPPVVQSAPANAAPPAPPDPQAQATQLAGRALANLGNNVPVSEPLLVAQQATDVANQQAGGQNAVRQPLTAPATLDPIALAYQAGLMDAARRNPSPNQQTMDAIAQARAAAGEGPVPSLVDQAGPATVGGTLAGLQLPEQPAWQSNPYSEAALAYMSSFAQATPAGILASLLPESDTPLTPGEQSVLAARQAHPGVSTLGALTGNLSTFGLTPEIRGAGALARLSDAAAQGGLRGRLASGAANAIAHAPGAFVAGGAPMGAEGIARAREAGGTGWQQAAAGLMDTALGTGEFMLPVAFGGGRVTRALTGAGSMEAINEVNNAHAGQPLGTNALSSAITGAVLGGMSGKPLPYGFEPTNGAVVRDPVTGRVIARGVGSVIANESGRVLWTPAQLAARTDLLRTSVAKQDLDERMADAARANGGTVAPEVAQQLAQAVATEHGAPLEAIFNAPATPMDAGAVAAQAAIDTARQAAGVDTAPSAARAAADSARAVQPEPTAAEASPATPADANGEAPAAFTPRDRTESESPIQGLPEPRPPALPELPANVTHDDLMQQWHAARTDREREQAATNIAAFDQQADRGAPGTLPPGAAPAEVRFSRAPSIPAPVPADIPDFPNLSSRQREVEARARQQVVDDPDAALRAYESLAGTDGGRIISTDEGREVFADYNHGPEARSANAVAVHEPASWIAKAEYAKQLANPPSGEQARVLFLGGGTGAGKTTGLKRYPGMATAMHDADIVYDGNLQSAPSAIKKIDQALATRRKVRIVYTFRDPVQAFVHGALPRAERADYGRTVPIPSHVGTHIGAAQTYLALKQHYADNPNVTIEAIHNDYDPRTGRSHVGNITDAEVAQLASQRRSTLESEVRDALESERQAGNVSDRVYHGTLENGQPQLDRSQPQGSIRRVDGLDPQPAQGPHVAGSARPVEAELPARQSTQGESADVIHNPAAGGVSVFGVGESAAPKPEAPPPADDRAMSSRGARDTNGTVATDKNVAGTQGHRAAGDESRREVDYRAQHRPAGPEFGARLDDLTDAFSDDIYGADAVSLHGHMIPADRAAVAAIQRVRGKPDAEVTIYRAVPKDAGDTIHPDDWVTLTRGYAREHGERVLDGNYKIISAKVPARSLYNEGNSIHEFGYRPNDSTAPVDPGVRLSRGPEATTAPHTADEVRAAAVQGWGSRFIKKLERAGALQFITSDDALTLKTRDNRGREVHVFKSAADAADVKGVYVDGTGYVITDHVRNLEAVPGIVVHEAGLHFGYDRLTKPEDRQALRNRVNRAVAMGDADVIKAWKHAERVGTPARALHEETMAYLVENHPGNSIAQRVIDAVKRGLNRAGIPMNLLESDSEAIRRTARDMLRRAAKGEAPGKLRVDENGASDWRASEIGGAPVFSRDDATKAAYDKRIDELFKGAKPNREGVRVLDEGDVLTITGYGKMPVDLVERHAIVEGGEKHPLKREQWKQIPEWLDNPAVVFKRVSDGHLTIIGPEKVNGHAVVMGLEPKVVPGRGAAERHLLLTAYEKDSGTVPTHSRMETGDLEPLYVDQRKGPSFYKDAGVQFPGGAVELRAFNASLKTGRDLVKYRAERDAADGSGTRFSRDLLGHDDSQVAKARREAAAARATALNQMAAEGYPQGAIGWTGNPNTYEGFRGGVQRAVAGLADRYDPIKRIQVAITGGDANAVGDVANVYRLENLMHGRTGDRLARLDRDEVRPLVKSMLQLHVSSDLLNDYLLARHAPERNARIASINKEMPDGGSGITTEQAKAFMAGTAEGVYSGKKLTPELRKKLKTLAKRVDQMRDETLSTLERSGQITPQLAAQLRKAYKYYVPLRGKASDVEGAAQPSSGGFGGRGIDVKGKPVRRALGRGESNLAPPHILGEIIGDAQRAIIQGEKARVGRALLRLAAEHPNPDVWQVEPVDLEWKFSESTGEAYLGTKKPTNDADVLTVVHNGTPYHVRLVDPRLQEAVMNMDTRSAEFMVQWIGKMNRWLSAAFTRFNPAFMPINMTRDLLLGTVGMTAEHGVGQAASTLKYYLPAMRAAWRDFGGKHPGDASVPDAKKTMDDWAREYAEAGGRTGIAMADKPEVIAKNLAASVKTGLEILSETTLHPMSWGKPVQAVGRALEYLKPVVDVVERANDATENAMRLAAYVARRKGGATPEAAADYAKNITVNFNRKGRWGPVLNSLFLFYNASLQGSRRIYQLVKDHPVGMAAFLGSLAALQAQQATVLMARKGSDGISDWDAIPDYKKSTALIIALPGKGNYFALPMPYEFGFVTYAGGRMTQHVIEHDPTQKHDSVAADLAVGFLHSFSPVPLEQGLTGLVPAPLQAFMDVRANKDDLGREITFGEDPNGYDKPQSSLGRPGVPVPYVWLSRELNKLGGGDPDWRPPPLAPSITDVSPDALQYLGNFFTGGIGSFVSGSWRTAESALAGVYETKKDGQTATDWAKLSSALPILSRFGIQTNVNRARSDRFYDIRDEMDRTKAMIQAELDKAPQVGLQQALANAERVRESAGIFGDGWTIALNRNGAPSTKAAIVNGLPNPGQRILEVGETPGSLAAAYREAEYGINVSHHGMSMLVQPGVRDYNRMIHADMGLPAVERQRTVKKLQDDRSGLMGAFLQYYELRQRQTVPPASSR